MAVGAYEDDDGGSTGADLGAVWILFLNQNGTVKSHQLISQTSGGFGGTLHDGDFFGIALAPIGDLDNNGIVELVVGASEDDDGGTDRGAGWVLPASYTCSTPTLGQTWTATVDLTTTGHASARLYFGTSPVTKTFAGEQTLLCGGRKVLRPESSSGPIATFTWQIPADPALCGRTFCTQAFHFGGVTPFALSNAQDLVLGFYF